MAALEAWLVPWAPYGRRGGEARPLCPVWPPRGRCPSCAPRMAAVGVCPVPWAPYGRRGGVTLPFAPYRCRGGVARPLGPLWPP